MEGAIRSPNAANIAILVENSVNNDPNWQMQSREYADAIKEWLKHVPAAERQKIKEASREFGLAEMDYSQRYLLANLDGDTSAHPEQAPSVQQHVAGFRPVKGFDIAWQHLVQDTASLNDVSASLKRGDSDSSLQMGNETTDDKTKAENTIRAAMQVMSNKVQRTIDELFNAS